MTTKQIEFWIAIDENGDFYVDTDSAGDAADQLSGERRVFHMKLTLPLPQATEVSATIPDTDAPVTVTVT